MDKERRVAIIIGAGPAGLTAAYRLLKEGNILPIILEQSNDIGGISRTAVYNKNRLDIGGHRFFSKNQEVTDLWKTLMPVQGAPAWDDAILQRMKPFEKGGPDPEKTDRVMLLRDRVSHIFYLRKFFDYPISIKLQTFMAIGLFRTVYAGFGYISAMVCKRKEKSLEDFYINRFGKPLYRMFFENYTEKLWGVHPSKISPDWGSQRIKGLSLSRTLLSAMAKPFRKKNCTVETSLIESFIYPKKGPGQFWEILADEIRKMGGEIIMNAKVVGINTADGVIQGVVCEKNRKPISFAGNIFFSSMPIKDLVEAMGSVVPENIRAIAMALPYRDFITVGLLVNKLKVANKTGKKTINNIVPDCWIYIQERDVRIGRLQIFNNWSPYMVDDVAHKVWLGLEYFCSEGDSLWNMSDDEFIGFAINELEKIDIIEKSEVVDAIRIKVRKAYPAYFGAYANFAEVRQFLDTYENLYCVGRNGQHRYNNMDHSMLSSMEAVRAAYQGGDKSVIWNVNTEEDYLEKKNSPEAPDPSNGHGGK